MKKLLIIGLAAVFPCIIWGTYLYNKPHKSVLNSEPELAFLADDFVNASKTYDDLANKIIEVAGKITLVEKNSETMVIILDNLVKCELEKLNSNTMSIGQTLKIKGLYNGYDELFDEISLGKCHIVK